MAKYTVEPACLMTQEETSHNNIIFEKIWYLLNSTLINTRYYFGNW